MRISCTQFVVRVVHLQRSAQKTAKGCTCAYCPLLEFELAAVNVPLSQQINDLLPDARYDPPDDRTAYKEHLFDLYPYA